MNRRNNILLSMLMPALVLLCAACAKTNPEPNTSRVSFAASLDGDIPTRSLTDGSAVDHLWCGAYLGGNLVAQADADVSGGKAIVALDLANNCTYDIVMWACKSGEGARWSFNLLTAEVTASYENQTASSADNDAFWYRGTIVPEGETRIAIELNRAVAQIHVGTTTSFTAVSDVVVNVSAIPSSWNLLTGVLNTGENRTFSLGADPGETFTIGSTTYNSLAAVCVLAPEEQTNTDIAFSLIMDGTPVSRSITDTSIRRNWCTRIAGNF